MKRGVWNAGSCISATRTRASQCAAEYSTAAPRQKPIKPGVTLSERLKWKTESASRPALSWSEEAITRTHAKTGQLLRTLKDSVMPVAPIYGVEGQAGNAPSDWKPEEWKDDWGSDALAPSEKRPPPPHIAGRHAKESPKPNKTPSSQKRSPIAYTRKIEGLIEPSDTPTLQDLRPTSEHKPIATLEHGLERVLFNPGVHWLQDPRSRVYNFPPHLENIPPVTDFAFERLPGFIKSSRDEDLRSLAERQNRMFAGSTSSLSGMLSHCYFLISEHKPVDITPLSQFFRNEDKNFTPGQRMPTSVVFNYQNSIYSIDSDSEDSSKNVLTWLGTLLEKFVTMSQEEFGTYLRSTSASDIVAEEDPMREAYRYAKSEKFVMRSQLDCVDRRLPGTGVFDIKTRACLPIRMDIMNWEENSGYLIKSAHGLVESFEREYYDLIRSAFLKYGFQVRIGNMDGVIVAYHNTAKMFGFQYVSLQEMDERLFGSEPGAGDRVFHKCVSLMECISSEIIQCFPNQTLKCTFECEEGSKELNVWVEPADWTDKLTEPPMKQLCIRTQSFLDESPVNGARAINSAPTVPWTLHWSLSHLSDDQEEIRKNWAKCMDRKFRAYSLPTGVSFEDLPQFWNDLNFGSPKSTDAETADKLQLAADFDYTKFRRPDERIQTLRDLARSGRELSMMLQEAEAGKKKIVLGEPYDISDVEIESYRTEEDRDIEGDSKPVAGVSGQTEPLESEKNLTIGRSAED